MPKKTKPRWGDHGVGDVPDFALSPGQARELSAMLGVARPKNVARLGAELSEIGCFYLRWSEQDEEGPTRAERNAALTEVLEASRRLETLLKALDHASEGELMYALAPYRWTTVEFDEEGEITERNQSCDLWFRQIQALRDRLTHFNEYAGPHLRRQLRQRGPEARKTLPAIIGMLAEIFERETDEASTHTPYKGTEYKSEPQSRAGMFVAAFIRIVDPDLPPSAISSTLARVNAQRKKKN